MKVRKRIIVKLVIKEKENNAYSEKAKICRVLVGK